METEFVEKIYLTEDNRLRLSSGVYYTFKTRQPEKVAELPECKFKKGDRVRLVNSDAMLMSKTGDILTVIAVDYQKEEMHHARDNGLNLYLLAKEGKGWLQKARESDIAPV